MYSMGKDWRNKNNINMFDPRQYNLESYYTSTHYKKEMKHSFGDELLSNLHLLPDPLKKNLADCIITEEKKEKNTDKRSLNVRMVETEQPKMEYSANYNMPTFGGITNFFSGVLNVISGAMANWRPKSPVQYHDCFDDNVSQGAPLSWHGSNNKVQNKSAREIHLNSKSDMNIDCKTAAAQCEDKLNKVRLLLTTKPIETPKSRSRRPKKAFVEAGSVEESFEDAFSPEDFSCVSNDTHIECYSPFQIHNKVLSETAAPKVKIEKIVNENTDIIKTLPEMTVGPEVIGKKSEEIGNSTKNNMVNEIIETIAVDNMIEVKEDEKSERQELVSSCEEKLSKLKALLQEKRKKNILNPPSPDSNTETVAMSNEKHTKPPRPHNKTKDKRYKNSCRTTDKRKKSRMRKSVQDDLVFAQEINGEDLSSTENSPSINSLDQLSDTVNLLQRHTNPKSSPVEYFDEVNGRFRSTSTTESEDSFQIVFSNSPKETRMRKISDCDSEDSFIVFEDTPDSCYTTNDVFGDSDESGSEYTDSELSDTDIQVSKLSHNLSRTVSDLTDGSLYEDNAFDEVDCAVRSVCDEIPNQEITDLSVKVPEEVEPTPTGLLLNEEKKLLKRQQPPKSVHFSPHPPKVHVMRVWSFAARQARAGHWERCALDRDRFKRRIADVDMAVSWVLKPQHRSRVMFQRFMPWWNAQRRKELAEKKERDERIKEEKRQEEQRLKEEAERLQQENLDNGNVSPDIVLINDKDQKQINDSEHNDVPNNDKGNETSNIVVINDKGQKQINDSEHNDVPKNDKGNETSDIVLINDREQKQINDSGNNNVPHNDTAVIVNDKLKNLKLNGIIKKYKLNKSQLNSTKIVPVSDKNEFTTKLRSEGLSST